MHSLSCWKSYGLKSWIVLIYTISLVPSQIAQVVACLTADPGVARSIPARSHTFGAIDHEIISTAILLPSADSRRVVVSYKRKYVHEVPVNRLVKLAQEKSVVRWTDSPDMTIVVDGDIKHQTKQTK